MSSRVLQIIETQMIQISEFRFFSLGDTLHMSFTTSSLESKAIRLGQLLRRSLHIFSVVWIKTPRVESLDELDQLAVSLRAFQEERSVETDLHSSFWRLAPSVRMTSDSYDRPTCDHETEIRLRWTDDDLHFLFCCDYKELSLRTELPRIHEPIDELWNWDVAEVFVAAKSQLLDGYCEFEISPQGEWLNLAIACTQEGLIKTLLTSKSECRALIDEEKKRWYAFLRVPLDALGSRQPQPGDQFKVNFFRSQGEKPVELAWKATHTASFHVPARFGDLLLVD